MGDFTILGISFLIFVVGVVGLAVVLPIKKAFLRWSAAAVASVVAAVAVGALLFFIFPNRALVVFEEVFDDLPELKGTELCHKGDTGSGPDNHIPWYTAYYLMPSSPGLESRIRNKATENGYKLKEDTEYIKQLKGLTDYSIPGTYSPNDTYLTAQKDGNRMNVRIIRAGEISLSCKTESITYGEDRKPGADRVILFLGVSVSSEVAQ